jgi:hypothetical protein
MIRERTLRARQKLVDELPVTGELLRGSLFAAADASPLDSGERFSAPVSGEPAPQKRNWARQVSVSQLQTVASTPRRPITLRNETWRLGRSSMKNLTYVSAAIALAACAVAPRPASALSAEFAKKCRELAILAHPTAPAGSSKGSSQAQREFYQDCIKKGGDTDSGETKK